MIVDVVLVCGCGDCLFLVVCGVVVSCSLFVVMDGTLWVVWCLCVGVFFVFVVLVLVVCDCV